MIALVKSYMVLECVQCEQFSVLLSYPKTAMQCGVGGDQCQPVYQRQRERGRETLAIALVTSFIMARVGIIVD